MDSKQVLGTSVVCDSLAASGGVDSQREPPLVGTGARATTGKPDAQGPRQLPSDWRFTIYLNSEVSGTILAQIVTLGDIPTQLKVSQEGHQPATWSGTQEIWYINTAALKSLSSQTMRVVITATPAKPENGIVSLQLDKNTTFAFGGLKVGQPANLFGIGTYNSKQAVPWAKPGPDPYASYTSYYFMGPSTSNPTLGLRFVVPNSGSTTLIAVQWYEVFFNPSAPAPRSINPGLKPDSSSGVAYTFSAVPPWVSPTGGVVWTAVSVLNAQ
ncbi:hypothetical protein [Sorangium sp. So ce1389]|uniref:hypothetical protein n=1 Tax=Sorangium sp. So ce1389 TaxID=3133336 RepID=UPI003F6125A6